MASIGNHFYESTDAKTIVRTVYGNSKCFETKVGMHPHESTVICDCNGSHIQLIKSCLLWELSYADDLVVIAEIEDNLIKIK